MYQVNSHENDLVITGQTEHQFKNNPLIREENSRYLFTYSSNQKSIISNGSLRLSMMFFELLEKQFPIRSLNQEMGYRFPVDFATVLFVHVNHLNRCVKEITGKTTSQVIAERIIKEACSLLHFTEWNIGEIGWCLGFEEGSHFINFFKKNIKMSPNAFRKIIRCGD